MEAKKFRIGNLIEAEGKIIEIGMIKEKFISWNVSKYPENRVWNPFIPTSDKRLKGIVINKEWLLKLGFNDDYNKGYLGIDVNNTDFVITEPKMMGEWQNDYAWQYKCTWDKFTEIKYVHELQNLFFALTGTELEIKQEASACS